MFKLNPILGHSRCTECGGSYSRRGNPIEDKKVLRLIEKAEIAEKKDILTPERVAKSNVKWLKFVKIPVVIEAFRTKEELHIQTLEGVMKANRGDWIIKGVAGELYPCKHSVFEKSFQRIKTEGVQG